MDLTHRFVVPATQEEAWAAFARLEPLAPCFPGATVTSVQGDDFSGSLQVKLGPVVLLYDGSGRYVDRDEHHGQLTLEFSGRDRRGNGTATALSTISLTGHGDQTQVEVNTDLSLTGKPAQLGRGVISDANDKLFDQFAQGVAGRFADGTAWATGSDEEAGAEPTVELGETPDDEPSDPSRTASGEGGLLDGVDAPPDVDTAPAAAAAPTPTPTRSTSPMTYAYTPPKDLSQSDFSVVATVAPALLKRYWPVLAGASVALFVTSKVIKGARR